MTEDKYNPPIVVLGMHRSGTSLISGILVELGVNMGNDPKHLKQHESNIFGHHEDKDFLSLNEEILKSQNLSWDNPPKYNYPDLDKEIITKISETIKSKQKQKYWGWKEPRTSVLIKSYLPYIPRAKYIICNRDNEEIYRSLIRRDQISRDKAKEITASYIKSINSFMKDNPDADILNINYSDLIESPEKYVKSIAKFIDTKPSKVNLKNAMNLVKPKDKLSSTISKLINKKAGDTPRVSLVVLSWNTKDSTLKCIDSLRKLKYSNKEIIVVDNGSSDGSKEALSKLKDVVYIDEPINLGFTGGQISALKEARGKYIALINSDAVVSRDWLNHLVGVAESDKKIAALGGRAYKWSEEYEAYDSSSPFYSYQEINPKTGYAETMDFGDEITDVHSISGAALLIRRSAIEKVGYFDNRFFAYFEETDLIARFIRAGMKAVFVPQAHVWHEIAASTKEVPKFYLYQMHRNRFIFGVKNVDNEHLMPFLINYTFEFFGSIFTYPLDGSIDKRMRIKAGLWNFFHLRKTFSDRKKVKKIGKSYSKKLKRY